MSFSLAFHPDVYADVDDAFRWYEQLRIGLGDEFLAALEIVYHRLEQTPLMHQVIYQDVRRSPFAAFSLRSHLPSPYRSRRGHRGA